MEMGNASDTVAQKEGVMGLMLGKFPSSYCTLGKLWVKEPFDF
jgi:hypothetical protein